MALTISRYVQVRGRPGPLWLVGNRGVRRCHCLSFKSVGYARRDCIFIPRVYLTRFQNALLEIARQLSPQAGEGVDENTFLTSSEHQKSRSPGLVQPSLHVMRLKQTLVPRA